MSRNESGPGPLGGARTAGASEPAASQVNDAALIVPPVDDVLEDERVAVRDDPDVGEALAPLDAIDVDLVWSHQFAVALAYMLRATVEFDTDAFRDLGVPEPSRPWMWGHAVNAASRRGDITCTGARRSRRPERHGALVRIWRASAHTDDAD